MFQLTGQLSSLSFRFSGLPVIDPFPYPICELIFLACEFDLPVSFRGYSLGFEWPWRALPGGKSFRRDRPNVLKGFSRESHLIDDPSRPFQEATYLFQKLAYPYLFAIDRQYPPSQRSSSPTPAFVRVLL